MRGAGDSVVDAPSLYHADPIQGEKAGEKAGDSFVTVERLLLALALDKDSDAGKILAKAGVTPQNLNAAVNALRKRRTADSATAENAYDALKKYARDLTQVARDGKLDPVLVAALGDSEPERRAAAGSQDLRHKAEAGPAMHRVKGRKRERRVVACKKIIR